MEEARQYSAVIEMPDPAVNIDIGVKAEVPADVVRQQSDALNEAISPFVHGLGYLGDRIAYFRFTSALKMLRRARSMATEEGLTLKAPPLKFLIPLIESASLEDEDSSLTEMWARLLVKASTNDFDPKYQLCKQILVNLSAKEAEILRILRINWLKYAAIFSGNSKIRSNAKKDFKEYFRTFDIEKVEIPNDESPNLDGDLSLIELNLNSVISTLIEEAIKASPNAFETLKESVHLVVRRLGLVLDNAAYATHLDNSEPYVPTPDTDWQNSASGALLLHYGLVKQTRVQVDNKWSANTRASVYLWHLIPTGLGVEFLNACHGNA